MFDYGTGQAESTIVPPRTHGEEPSDGLSPVRRRLPWLALGETSPYSLSDYRSYPGRDASVEDLEAFAIRLARDHAGARRLVACQAELDGIQAPAYLDAISGKVLMRADGRLASAQLPERTRLVFGDAPRNTMSVFRLDSGDAVAVPNDIRALVDVLESKGRLPAIERSRRA